MANSRAKTEPPKQLNSAGEEAPGLIHERRKLQRYFLTKEALVAVHSAQRRPNTVVFATFRDPDGNLHTNVGISKVCHPDIWDQRKGYELALEKAAANAAKDHVNGVHGVKESIDSSGHRGPTVRTIISHYNSGK